MEIVENRMVVDSQWDFMNPPEEARERLNGAGYSEIGTGVFVAEEDAYSYALERLSLDAELQKEFMEWFYSGDWVKKNGTNKDHIIRNHKGRTA